MGFRLAKESITEPAVDVLSCTCIFNHCVTIINSVLEL